MEQTEPSLVQISIESTKGKLLAVLGFVGGTEDSASSSVDRGARTRRARPSGGA